MPFAAELKDTFEKLAIKKVAIVDDAYDAPDFAGFARDGRGLLRNALVDLGDRIDDSEDDLEIEAHKTDLALRDEIERSSGRGLRALIPDLQDQAIVELLWQSYIDAEPGSALRQLLSAFEALGADKRDKLRPLRRLRELLSKVAGVETVDEYNSTTTADEVVGYDMVFLDFYLSEEVPSNPDETLTEKKKADARDRSIAFLKELVEREKERAPLVMLISSMASSEDVPFFRDQAEMFASKLAFLPKQFAETDEVRAQHTILSLAKHRPNADALADLSKAWRKAVSQAADDMMISLRKLELTDYSYLNEYRLASEKIPLPHYLAWLFSGQLTDLVERRLKSDGVDEAAGKIHLPEAIPGRIAPTTEITRFYSALTTSSLQVGSDGFEPLAWSGDILVDTAKYNEIFGTDHKVLRRRPSLPQVLAVITPSCDLVPQRTKVQTVTMIGGELKPLCDATNKNNMLVMLNGKPFVVVWNAKWPVTMALSAMGAKSSMAGRYRWVGRLRELYHAELQHKLLTDIGRIGLPVPPPMSENVAIKVLARVREGNDGYSPVYQATADEGAAWTFAGEESERALSLKEEVVWKVREGLRSIEGASVAKLRDLLANTDKPEFLKSLPGTVVLKKDKVEKAYGLKVEFRKSKDLESETGQGASVPLVIAFAA